MDYAALYEKTEVLQFAGALAVAVLLFALGDWYWVSSGKWKENKPTFWFVNAVAVFFLSGFVYQLYAGWTDAHMEGAYALANTPVGYFGRTKLAPRVMAGYATY